MDAGDNVAFESVEFQSNDALHNDDIGWDGYGGALYMAAGSHVTVRDATALDNASDRNGGAFFLRDRATLDLHRVWMEGNQSKDDAGALGIRGTASLSQVMFSGNVAADSGGAVRVAHGGDATFRDVVFRDNQAHRGGAVMI